MQALLKVIERAPTDTGTSQHEREVLRVLLTKLEAACDSMALEELAEFRRACAACERPCRRTSVALWRAHHVCSTPECAARNDTVQAFATRERVVVSHLKKFMTFVTPDMESGRDLDGLAAYVDRVVAFLKDLPSNCLFGVRAAMLYHSVRLHRRRTGSAFGASHLTDFVTLPIRVGSASLPDTPQTTRWSFQKLSLDGVVDCFDKPNVTQYTQLLKDSLFDVMAEGGDHRCAAAGCRAAHQRRWLWAVGWGLCAVTYVPAFGCCSHHCGCRSGQRV